MPNGVVMEISDPLEDLIAKALLCVRHADVDRVLFAVSCADIEVRLDCALRLKVGQL